jgi:CRISPR-associated protein Cas5d
MSTCAHTRLIASGSPHVPMKRGKNQAHPRSTTRLGCHATRHLLHLYFWDHSQQDGDAVSSYSIQLEVSGPLAMYARPDTGGSPTSYPIPTWSAAKGLLESIAYLAQGEAWFHPTCVEICRPTGSSGGAVSFQRYAFNYGGPLRKDVNIKSGTGMQVFATAVANPCYRIYADIHGARAGNGRNPRHYLQDLFARRLKQGRCFKTPALGWSEFTCDYWGQFRPEWEVDDALDFEIPSMLFNVWDRPQDGAYVSRFAQNVRIEKGVCSF